MFKTALAGIWFGAPRVGLDPVLARQFQIDGAVLTATQEQQASERGWQR